MYIPNNLPVFLAAFNGAVAGMSTSDRSLTDPSPTVYADVVANAGAFAQSFDTLIPPSPPPIASFYLNQLTTLCQSAWQDRTPSASIESITPSFYTVGCQALLAVVTAEVIYLAGQGVAPPLIAEGLILVSPSDTTANYLASKLLNGGGLSFQTLNPGANEQLQVKGAQASFINSGASVDVPGTGVPTFLNGGFTHTNLNTDPFGGPLFVRISWSVSFRRFGPGGPDGDLIVTPTIDGLPVPVSDSASAYAIGIAGQAVQLTGFHIVATDNAPHIYNLLGTNTPTVLLPADAMRVQNQSVEVSDVFI